MINVTCLMSVYDSMSVESRLRSCSLNNRRPRALTNPCTRPRRTGADSRYVDDVMDDVGAPSLSAARA